MLKAALKNPYLVIVIVLMVAVIGGISVLKIPADLLPTFETSAAQIVCFYPGMPPEVMEQDIMSRLQRWTGQSSGIEHQEAHRQLPLHHIGHADHSTLGDFIIFCQHLFHGAGRQAVTGNVDYVVCPGHHEDIAVLVDKPGIPGLVITWKAGEVSIVKTLGGIP